MSASSVTSFKSTDVQPPAFGTPMAILPEEIRQQIFTEAGNPHASEACREWRDLNFNAYRQRFIEYRKSALICPFMPQTTTPQTVDGCARLVKETVHRIHSYFLTILEWMLMLKAMLMFPPTFCSVQTH